jgi:hypothetical protein
MFEPQPSRIDPDAAAAFLASVNRRLADLDGVEATCPFEPMVIANTFISRIRDHTNVVQVCHTYAEAMLAIDPSARQAWEKLNAEIEIDAHSWPYGLSGVKEIAAKINRKKGAMPCPARTI